MATRNISDQIAFRYCTKDSATGITRETARRLAAQLGVDETQAIHMALYELAVKILPQYEADDAPLTSDQLRRTARRQSSAPCIHRWRQPSRLLIGQRKPNLSQNEKCCPTTFAVTQLSEILGEKCKALTCAPRQCEWRNRRPSAASGDAFS
jgi:hypothetical protein